VTRTDDKKRLCTIFQLLKDAFNNSAEQATMDDRESSGGKFVKWSVLGPIMDTKFKFLLKSLRRKAKFV